MAITGKMRSRVDIQKPSPIKDAYGQPINTWITLGTVWAWVHAISMRESFNAGLFDSHVTHKVTIRFPGKNLLIVPGYRVVYTNQTEGTTQHLVIQAVDNVDQRNRTLELLALQVNEGD